MWHPFVILLGHIISSTIFAGTSAELFNGTGLSKLSVSNTHRLLSKTEPDASPNLNQTVHDLSVIPAAFSVRFYKNQDRPIRDISTYMTALLAMIAISSENYLARYAGGECSFKNYADVRMDIWSANSPTTPLQPRHAIWGLHVAIYTISLMNAWYETTIILRWTRSGTRFPVGFIYIEQGSDGCKSTPGLANTTQALGSQPYLTRPPNSSDLLEQGINTFGNRDIAIDVTFGSEILTLREIFLTLMPAVEIISEHPAGQLVIPFDIQDETIDCKFQYQGVHPPRMQAPFFQYQDAAVALRILAKTMTRTLVDVEFTVKVDDVPVGMGSLKRPERSSATLMGTS